MTTPAVSKSNFHRQTRRKWISSNGTKWIDAFWNSSIIASHLVIRIDKLRFTRKTENNLNEFGKNLSSRSILAQPYLLLVQRWFWWIIMEVTESDTNLLSKSVRTKQQWLPHLEISMPDGDLPNNQMRSLLFSLFKIWKI